MFTEASVRQVLVGNTIIITVLASIIVNVTFYIMPTALKMVLTVKKHCKKNRLRVRRATRKLFRMKEKETKKK